MVFAILLSLLWITSDSQLYMYPLRTNVENWLFWTSKVANTTSRAFSEELEINTSTVGKTREAPINKTINQQQFFLRLWNDWIICCSVLIYQSFLLFIYFYYLYSLYSTVIHVSLQRRIWGYIETTFYGLDK